MQVSLLSALAILGAATALPPLTDEPIAIVGLKKPLEKFPLKMIPEGFDAREAWPDCADIIGMIMDQSRCDSGWAFAAAEAMSDRICISSKATRKLFVSAQDLLSCGYAGGCDGSIPDLAWLTWLDTGIMTGGLYNHTEQGCKSYFLPPCDDHLNNCTDYVITPECLEQCDNTTTNYESERTYGDDLYFPLGETEIQIDLMTNGPVVASFDIYSDFANYTSGIYQRTSEEYEGGHAVKIIGWGVEDGVKYWLCANSWNERWGEDGYFRILRGVNEANIEDSISAGSPDFSRF